MKITFGMIVFNGNYVLRECIESIYQFADQILISEGPVQFWQDMGYLSSNDGTISVLSEIPDLEHKIKIVHGQFKEKDEQCNAYMSMLDPKTDYIWNLDCDEIFKPKDVEKLLKLIDEGKYTSVGFTSQTFFGGMSSVITGFEQDHEFMRIRKVYPGSYWATHRPPTIAHQIPKEKQLEERHLSCKTLAEEYDIYMYHYSYTFPMQVYTKINYYRNAVAINNCIPNYFNEVYLPWVMAKNRSGKQVVENKYNGVHEFLPNYRGPARTKVFQRKHPDIILRNIYELRRKFRSQLELFI